MCELMTFCGKEKILLNPFLQEFFSHSAGNPDGWGLAVFDPGQESIEKEPLQASESLYLQERLRGPIVSKALMAHIRAATIGVQTRLNCHPFAGRDESGRQWIMVHNGTLFEKTEADRFISAQTGDTDSERILLALLDRMNREIRRKEASGKGGRLSPEERFRILDRMIVAMSPGNKLNLIIFDGELFYIHCNMKGTLYWRKEPCGTLINTVPLSLGTWEPVPFTRLTAMRDGQVQYEGTDHGNEYRPDPEQVQALYRAFSGL